MKYIFFILLLISGTCYGQTKYYIRADTTQLEKVGGNNELNLLNSTRSRTGAYLKNTLNGRTGFFYAVDSAYISGTNLVLVRGGGSQNVTVPIGGTTPTWQQTLVAGSVLNQGNTVDIGGNDLFFDNGDNIWFTSTGSVILTNSVSGAAVGTDTKAYLDVISASGQSTIKVYVDTVKIEPFRGNVNIDSLQSGAATDSLITWNASTGAVGKRPPSTAASSVPINGLTASTGTNGLTIGHAQTWTSSLTTATPITLTTSTMTTGNLLSLTSTSTALVTNSEALNIDMSGANGGSGVTTTGARISVGNTGTSSTSIGLNSFAGGGATANWGIYGSALGAGAIAIRGAITGSSDAAYAGYFDNAAATITTAYGIFSTVGGANTTNIAGSFSATGATTNNALNIAAGALALNGSAGTSGQVLTSAGVNTLPTWETPSGGSLTIGTTAIASGTTTRLLFEGTSNILQEDADFTVDQTNNLINSYASSSAGKVQVGQLNGVSGYGAIYFGQTPSATNYAIAGTTTELLINSGFGDIKYMYGTLLVGKQIDTRWGIGYNVAPLTGTELTVTTGDATFRALVLKAVGSQSENIMEIRDNSDAILSRVGPTGEIRHSTLAGSGSRAVLADAEGDLSAPVSDRRAKENIRPMSSALGMIGAFNPVTFEYKEGYKKFGNGTQVGFIAQEIDDILPNSVYTNIDGTKGYNATDLIPILVKAVQEQQKMIEDLQKEIKTLKKQK